MEDTFKIEICGDVATTPDFWDCECDTDYIHPKTQEFCLDCDTVSHDQPDAHAIEVIGILTVADRI